MLKWKKFYLPLALILWTSASHATVTLLEKDEWKVMMSGFVEMDNILDSRRSLTEVAGSAPIDRPGTLAGDNGRLQSSLRNSRFAFTVLPPMQSDWKIKGYLEMDFLGYNPAPSTSQSESAFFTNPTLRLRHSYLSGEKNGWTTLAGQTWTLFGWQPYYVMTTVSVPPAPGELYQRTPQITEVKAIELGESSRLQVAASLTRPSQRDSQTPNLDVGVRYAYAGFKAAFASPSGEINAEPTSVALSGTFRSFETPDSASAAAGKKIHNGNGVAFDLMLPILPAASKDDVGNSLTLTGEFSTGSGFGDEFPSWTANLAPMSAGSGAAGIAGFTNLDAGQGGYDGGDSFHLLTLQAWNAQLQYHLPGACRSFVNVGYGELKAYGLGGLVTFSKTGYDRSSVLFVNYFHDVTKQIRVAAEYANFSTHYVDDVKAHDDRYQITGYFRF